MVIIVQTNCDRTENSMKTSFLLSFFFLIFCQECRNKVFHLGLHQSAWKPVDLLNPVKMLPDRKTGHEIPVSQLLRENHILHPEARCRTQQHWQEAPEQNHHPRAYIFFTAEYSQGRSYSLSFPCCSPAYKCSSKLLRKFLLPTSSVQPRDSKTCQFSFKQYQEG